MTEELKDNPGSSSKAPVIDGMAHPDPKLFFKVRRETMLRAIRINIYLVLLFFALIVGADTLGYDLSKTDWIGTLIGWSFFTNSLPIIGYFSNTAIDEFAKRKL